MIRYPITAAKLEERIAARAPNWKTTAAVRTATLKAQGRYIADSSLWSDIKDVYVELQHGKF